MNVHETTSIIILALIFGVYAWLATLAFGVALLRLLPKWDTSNMAAKLTHPFLETSDVVLVLGCISVASIFDTRISEVASELVPTLLIGLAAIIVRAALLFYVSYRVKRSVIIDALLATASFMVPASMAAAGIYLITGQAFWVTLSGWVFMLMSLALIKAIALAFVYWHAKDTADHRLQWATRMSIGVFAVLAAVAAQLVVREDSPHLISLPFGILVVLAASTILWQGALMTTKRADHGIWWCLSLIIVTMPVLLALANAPWLGYAHFKVSQIYDADGFATVIYAGLFSLLFTAVILAGGRRRLALKTPKSTTKKPNKAKKKR